MVDKAKKLFLMIGICMAAFLGCIDFTIVNTALPAIQKGLGPTVSQLQWVINIFLLGLASLMVIMGRLEDLYGRRKVLYIGMLVFGISSLGAGISTSFAELIFFRAIQGIACAVLYTATGAIVSNAFSEEKRGHAMGILFGVNGLGLAVGPVVGGFLVGLLSWHWVFLVNVPLIIISFLFCLPSVDESKNTEHGDKVDWWGFILLLIGLCSLIIAVIEGASWGWASADTLILFAIAIVSLVALYLVEMKIKSPIIQFHLFINRAFISSVIANFCLAAFYCTAFFLMPLFLTHIRNESADIMGLMLLPTTAIMAAISPLAGRMINQYGAKKLLLLGFACLAISALFQTFFEQQSSLAAIIFAFAVFGVGWACILGPATVAALSSVPESVGGTAMGSVWTMHNIGGVIGLAVGVMIYQNKATSTAFSIRGYSTAMEFLLAVCVAAFVAILLIMKKKVK